tara:strand:- start:305 stop:475 length:171 start_codon:yes stop_codon:yes gene_type:complete
MKNKSKKEWKWSNNPVKKDLFSGKYGQRIKQPKKDISPSLKEEMSYYLEDKNYEER